MTVSAHKNEANIRSYSKTDICTKKMSETLTTRREVSEELSVMNSLWRYIPAQIHMFVCNIVALNYRSFLHSSILLLQFNIAHSQSSVHISNAMWIVIEHATFMGLYGVKCDMLATQSNILFSHIPNQYPYFAFKFLPLTCDIRVFQCNVDTWCVCCGAECDMPATQSNILLCTLNFTLE